MNQSHYPDLERCKKLTELGFPKTEESWNCDKAFIGDENLYAIQRSKSPSVKDGYSIDLYVCPSVMEMWDLIPYKEVQVGILNDMFDSGLRASDTNGNSFYSKKEPPNALADLIVWLVENEHLSFK